MHLDALREKVERLKRLLDDPHPGLHTWVIALDRAIVAITREYHVDFIRESFYRVIPKGDSP